MFTVVMSLTVIFFSTVAKINKIFISFSSLQRIHGVVGKNNGETNIYITYMLLQGGVLTISFSQYKRCTE